MTINFELFLSTLRRRLALSIVPSLNSNCQILKFELPDVGVPGVFHEWLTSYFHNERSQYVNVTNARSKLRQIGIGVPKVLSWDPDCLHYMLTTYRIPPKLDESICLQMTLPSTTLGTNSKKLLMRYT